MHPPRARPAPSCWPAMCLLDLKHRQDTNTLLKDLNVMSSLVSACRRWSAVVAVGAFPLLADGLPHFDSQGTEYPITGALKGDQLFSQMALNAFGGYLVWQDNATDGDGFGISARHINRNLSGA